MKSKKDNGAKSKFSLMSATVIVAILGFIGTTVGTYLQGLQNINLERERLRSNLIIGSLDFQDSEDRVKYLRFILDLGLIDDIDTNVLQKYYEEPELIPYINKTTPENYLVDSMTHEQLKLFPTDLAKNSISGNALKVAINELGNEVIENAENSSPNIDRYLQPLNIENFPWSAAFVSYCYYKNNTDLPFKYTASFAAILSDLQKLNLIDTLNLNNPPQPGDIYILFSKSNFNRRQGGIIHHIEYPWIFCIEGNNKNRLQGLKRNVEDSKYTYYFSKIR